MLVVLTSIIPDINADFDVSQASPWLMTSHPLKRTCNLAEQLNSSFTEMQVIKMEVEQVQELLEQEKD